MQNKGSGDTRQAEKINKQRYRKKKPIPRDAMGQKSDAKCSQKDGK